MNHKSRHPVRSIKTLLGVFLITLMASCNIFKDDKQVVITPQFAELIKQYDELMPFSEGMAAVKKDDKWGYIDNTGELVIPCQYKMRVGQFSDGLACVDAADAPRIEFIDKKGVVIIKGDYFYGFEYEGPAKDTLNLPHFQNGICAVWTNYMNGKSTVFHIDKKGQRTQKSPVARKDNNRYVKFTRDGKYGYRTADGEVIIPAEYNFISDIYNGVALVKLDSKDSDSEYDWNDIVLYGYVDLHGNSTFSRNDFDKIEQVKQARIQRRREEERKRREKEERKRREEEQRKQNELLGWLQGNWRTRTPYGEIRIGIYENMVSVWNNGGHFYTGPYKIHTSTFTSNGVDYKEETHLTFKDTYFIIDNYSHRLMVDENTPMHKY